MIKIETTKSFYDYVNEKKKFQMYILFDLDAVIKKIEDGCDTETVIEKIRNKSTIYCSKDTLQKINHVTIQSDNSNIQDHNEILNRVLAVIPSKITSLELRFLKAKELMDISIPMHIKTFYLNYSLNYYSFADGIRFSHVLENLPASLEALGIRMPVYLLNPPPLLRYLIVGSIGVIPPSEMSVFIDELFVTMPELEKFIIMGRDKVHTRKKD